MAKMGRPEKPINWKQVESMCRIQCTEEEIAAICDVSIETLKERCKKEHGMTFREFFKQKRQGGKASLRRTQWKMAETTPSLAIWLGKQYLGQSEKHENKNETKHSGEVSINFIEKS